MTAAGSGGCSGGCRRRPGWRWLWLDPWHACRWRWKGKSSCTDAHLWLTWWVSESQKRGFVCLSVGSLFLLPWKMHLGDNQGQWNICSMCVYVSSYYSEHITNVIRGLQCLNRKSAGACLWKCLRNQEKTPDTCEQQISRSVPLLMDNTQTDNIYPADFDQYWLMFWYLFTYWSRPQ